jgi:hypothetical protein
MSKVYIVTVATEKKYYMQYLEDSIKKNNGELIILGYGQKWEGFNWRNKLMIDFLEKTNPDDIVCFIDGYDVLCLRDLNLLKDKFIEISNREKCKIIVGLEQHITINNRYYARYLFGTCKDNSINAGTYIGYSKDLIDILKIIISKNPDNDADDQLLLTKYCNFNINDVYLDMKNELFLTLVKSLQQIKINEDVEIIGEELIYKNEKPFFIHGPSTFIDDIIIKLNYNYDYNNKPFQNFLKDYKNKEFSQFITFLRIKRDDIFFILLIIIFIITIFIIRR